MRLGRLAAVLVMASGLVALAAAPSPTEVEWAQRTLEQRKATRFRQQKAVGILGRAEGPAAAEALAKLMAELEAGALPPMLQLDVLEALAQRTEPALQTRLQAWRERQAQTPDVAARYGECLEGGDGEEGFRVFTEMPQAGCARCHRAAGVEGGAIGPDLNGLGGKTERIHMLEAVVAPNATIVPGFKHVLVELQDGETVSGVLQVEGAHDLVVVSLVDGARRSVPTAKVRARTELPSAMPPGFGEALTRRQLRDVIEYLAVGR